MPASWTWRTGTRCGASRPVDRAARTSARSSTGPCGWSASCSSACGPRAPRPRRRTRCASWPSSPRRPGSEVLDGLIQRRGRPDPATYVGSGKAAELAERRRLHRRRHRDLRRRADPRPAAPAGGDRQGQGHRPDGADPRHLRPARAEQGGQGPGRAGPAAVPAAAAARLGRVAVPAGRRPGRPGGGGIGTRGPGETKIETDRRRIRTRIAKLRREIAEMSVGREVQRGQRRRARGAVGGHRRLHQRRQVQPAQPADRGARAGGQRAVRHAGPDRAQGPDPAGRAVHADRHRRVRPAPAAPAGRGVPLHAGGGRRRRPDPARGRRLRRRPAGAARRGPRGARPRSARANVPELVVINKADAADPIELEGLRLAEPDVGRGLGPHRRRASTSCSPSSSRRLPRRDARGRPSCCPTTAGTWSPARTARARCWPSGTARTAPSCTRQGPARPGRRARPVRGHPGHGLSTQIPAGEPGRVPTRTQQCPPARGSRSVITFSVTHCGHDPGNSAAGVTHGSGRIARRNCFRREAAHLRRGDKNGPVHGSTCAIA